MICSPESIDRASLAYGMFLQTCVLGTVAWVWYTFAPGPDDGVRDAVKRKRRIDR